MISIEKAATLLQRGEVVAVPTETVYGLAASLECVEGIKKIYELKGRPSNNPLIIHLFRQEEISPYVAGYPPFFQELAKAFWPGPLTIILPIKEKVPPIVRANLPTAAFRIPSHPIALELLKRVGPLVMPSANLSGKPSATKGVHIETDFGKDFPYLEDTGCKGLESTIIHYHEAWQIVRVGFYTAEDFIPILGYEPKIAVPQKDPICPGQLYRHYAPKALLTLAKRVPETYEGVILGFNDRSYPPLCRIIFLGRSHDPLQVAANLYDSLRKLDEEKVTAALVDIDIPQRGLWATIRERLERASAR